MKNIRVGENAIQKLQRLQKKFHAELGGPEYVDLVFESDGDVSINVVDAAEKRIVTVFTGTQEQVLKYLQADQQGRLIASVTGEI